MFPEFEVHLGLGLPLNILLHEVKNGYKGTYTQAPGQTRGGFSTKVHLIGDAHGNPLYSCFFGRRRT